MARKTKPRRPAEPELRRPAPGTNLGDFGDDIPENEYAFTWCKEADIRVHPEASLLREVDFIEEAMGYEDTDPRNITVIKDQLRTIIHEEDFDLFWSIALRKRQGVEQLQRLQRDIFAALAGRPTGLPDASAPGQQTTEPKSTDTSPSEDPVALRLAGRPDLQLAVYQADLAAQQEAG